ncbi:MAG: DUF2997 domain-containing protein [Elusimicrobiota bacterium]
MVQKDIEIEITPDGEVNMDLIGFEGKGCEKVADELIKILGKNKLETKKPEWYKKQKVKMQQRRR